MDYRDETLTDNLEEIAKIIGLLLEGRLGTRHHFALVFTPEPATPENHFGYVSNAPVTMMHDAFRKIVEAWDRQPELLELVPGQKKH